MSEYSEHITIKGMAEIYIKNLGFDRAISDLNRLLHTHLSQQAYKHWANVLDMVIKLKDLQ